MEATMSTTDQVFACLRYLAGQCDGAASKDGHGFNKLDVQFGHDLAMRKYLTRNQMVTATRMLKKYSKQLEAAGLVVPTVADAAKEPETTGEDSMEENMIVLTGQTATINDVEPIENETAQPEIVLSAEQQAVLKTMEETRQHLYITGKAGVGKSVLLREFRKQTKKKIVVAAPTGIAALNVQGQTIHSLFKLPTQLQKKGHLEANEKANTLLKRIDAIVIDEISMVRADVLDAIDERMRQACDNSLPFGGKQLIMIGDVFQLPPVVEKDLRDYFDRVYGGVYFFNATVWQKTEFKVFELTQVFRQKDSAFKDILNAVRDGSVVEEQIASLNVRYGVALPKEGTVTLATTNALVTQINQERLDRLPGKAYQYNAVITGTMEKNSFPTEERLYLKKDAQVVLLKNDQNGRWVNGSVGVIEKLSDISIEVRVNGVVHTLEKNTWEEIAYTYENDEIKAKVVSSFEQYPIRLAWALTVHKSQGQTYENVCLDLTRPTFAHGQLYVALSRATSLQGLYLKMPVKMRDVIVDPKVTEFMARREAIAIEVEEKTQTVIDTTPVSTERPFGPKLTGFFEAAIQDAAQRGFTVQAVVEAPAIEIAKPTVKTLLPTEKHKGGSGHKSELSVKVAYKFSADVAAKLNKLAEDTGVNKSAFIDGLLATWFEEHGM